MSEVRTSWFTFGFDHEHVIDGQLFDKDTIVKVTAPNPRGVMVEKFGNRWAFEYSDAAAQDEIKRWGYKAVELSA